MSGPIHRLTTLEVTRKKLAPGRYADGGGLYLEVSAAGWKRWILRYQLNKRRRDMSLGSVAAISLSEARQKAGDARKMIEAGTDPIDQRECQKRALQAEQAKAVTFKEAAHTFIDDNEAGWKNPKHRQQWTNTLKTYAFPVIGDLNVADVETAHVVKVVKPIWKTKPETANRVRGRIERVLNWAKTAGHREGENPARWKGHLENLLPKRGDVQTVKPHPALPYRDVGAFVAKLREREGYAALGLEFAILTGTRTSEVVGATKAEIDVEQKVWTIPAARMKAKKEHRVPLSDRALAIVETVLGVEGDYLFPGGQPKRPLSTNAFRALLIRMGHEDLTVHGFRSTFRDWVSEQTAYPHEVAEQALAHTISSAVERAYRRGDLFEKRRRLMTDWAKYCATIPSERDNVTPIGQRLGQANVKG